MAYSLTLKFHKYDKHPYPKTIGSNKILISPEPGERPGTWATAKYSFGMWVWVTTGIPVSLAEAQRFKAIWTLPPHVTADLAGVDLSEELWGSGRKG